MSTLPHSHLERKDSNGWAKAGSKYAPWSSQGGASITLSNRRFRSCLPDLNRRSRRRWATLISFTCWSCAVIFLLFTLTRRWRNSDGNTGGGGGTWNMPTWESKEPSSLVYSREDLRRIWEWEIASHHYPTRKRLPPELGFSSQVINPAVSPSIRNASLALQREGASSSYVTEATPAGPRRVYLDIASHPPSVAYPPRPVPGSIADFDILLDHCDFDRGKYVRDCLEVLRVGAGLDNGKRHRRENLDEWRYIFLEDHDLSPSPPDNPLLKQKPADEASHAKPALPELETNPYYPLEANMQLPPPVPHKPYSASSPCDDDHKRLFHMFWTGPFTDKPYIALLSFLYTQNTGIHLSFTTTTTTSSSDSPVCRPQFWVWINPGAGATVAKVFDQLKKNSWSAPFLHPRFRDVIVFKIWNTTEQLDSIPEIKNEWRAMDKTVFRGKTIKLLPAKPTSVPAAAGDDDDLKTGPTSESDYDRLSVTLSDMVRFVVCHRFGGIYLDADTIFLRDWEELWGWKGSFAYRWSRLPKYNTAVLRMSAGSALGTFIFRTAVKWGLDFHPMTIAKYLEEAASTGLLMLLPDAFFDAAWLNTEDYQRDRPPQPYFTQFGDLFNTPAQNGAAPQALGFEGFFRGSFSYHFHNFWWQPFDPARNWPDLGPRFAETEKSARTTALKKQVQEKRDLDWSTVLKRTFEGYIRGEQPNMYGEWIQWS